MIVKSTKHEPWAIDELRKVAKRNGVASIDSIIRLAVYRFLIEDHKRHIKITEQSVKDTEFEARVKIGIKS